MVGSRAALAVVLGSAVAACATPSGPSQPQAAIPSGSPQVANLTDGPSPVAAPSPTAVPNGPVRGRLRHPTNGPQCAHPHGRVRDRRVPAATPSPASARLPLTFDATWLGGGAGGLPDCPRAGLAGMLLVQPAGTGRYAEGGASVNCSWPSIPRPACRSPPSRTRKSGSPAISMTQPPRPAARPSWAMPRRSRRQQITIERCRRVFVVTEADYVAVIDRPAFGLIRLDRRRWLDRVAHRREHVWQGAPSCRPSGPESAAPRPPRRGSPCTRRRRCR